jgi:threonine aldolase
MCQSYHSVIAHEVAHIETDECGAPHFFSNGVKLLLMAGDHGKVTPDGIEKLVKKRSDIHYPKPRVVSITQSTELGTVYSVSEIEHIGRACKQHNLRLHMDGARFANAVAALGVAPKEITWKVGVDVLSFGGSKNGLPLGEAVVFFNKELAREFDFRCKQAGQLCSKMRFLAAPWVGMLHDGAWLKHAGHANAMAARMETALKKIAGVGFLSPRQANAVFIELPNPVIEGLWAKGWLFYNFIGKGGCRLMCAWDTQPEDVDRFVSDLTGLMG